MGLFVHDTTTPTHPKDDPEVRAKGHEVEQARTVLNDIERRARELEAERDAHHDEVHVLLTAQEGAGLRARYIDARLALSQAQRSYDAAFQKAQGPWQQAAMALYREKALTWLTWLETEALVMNDAMLRAQEAAEAAGVRVEPLHIPYLLPDAIAHRCKVGRAGLG